MHPGEDQIAKHYSRENLFEKILEVLDESGIKRQDISWKDISAVDEFHVRGLEVSRELASAAGISPGTEVLDVGCGIGGPARMLADEFGCRVTGIDLTLEYVRTAKLLSAITGLDTRTYFVHGTALALPFPDGSFDAVWTQHVQMNIADKHTFYAEIHRVLKKNGLFIYYDIFSTGEGDIIYPVPWAEDPSHNFLVTTEELHSILSASGFILKKTNDETRKGFEFFEKIKARETARLSLELLIGENTALKMKNIVANITTRKIVIESGICEKPV